MVDHDREVFPDPAAVAARAAGYIAGLAHAAAALRSPTIGQINCDPRFQVTMEPRPGGMRFLNSHIITHRRTACQDQPEPERRRLLIRVCPDA